MYMFEVFDGNWHKCFARKTRSAARVWHGGRIYGPLIVTRMVEITCGCLYVALKGPQGTSAYLLAGRQLWAFG